MKQSESQFLQIRGLRYHVRRWPSPGAPKIVLLHGWMDVSASFQFLVDALAMDWDLYAPDWRGYGLTEWGRADCYWFPDYIADLDRLLEQVSPQRPVNLVGHSLGGNVGALYAGVCPARVARFANLEASAWRRHGRSRRPSATRAGSKSCASRPRFAPMPASPSSPRACATAIRG
jgi:pimeloyl-ACP methyl ester carboxylesterase